MGVMKLEMALSAIKNQNLCPIARIQVPAYDLNNALRVIEAIGKSNDPCFVIDDDNRFAYENILKWLHGDPSMLALHPETRQVIQGDTAKGIYIAGKTGSGKTWCLDIVKEYLRLYPIPIAIRERKMRMWWKTVRADDIVARFVETTSIDEYKRESMLCIHDFGAEPLEASAMGNKMNVLRNLLEHRGDNRSCMTLITSNYSLRNPTLAENYGERVTSRLCGMCNYFEISGKDRRRL